MIPDQKVVVYKYLADNLHNLLYSRPQQKLEEEEVKRVIRVVLKGLATIHKKNIAYTGMLYAPLYAFLAYHNFTEARLQILNPTILSSILTSIVYLAGSN